MSIEDDIKFLSKYEQFARFMQTLDFAKDAAVNDMLDSPTDKLQQISGKIIAYDDILKMVKFDKLRQMHGPSLS